MRVKTLNYQFVHCNDLESQSGCYKYYSFGFLRLFAIGNSRNGNEAAINMSKGFPKMSTNRLHDAAR